MKDRVFRDQVHGIIEFEGHERRFATVLETRALQRLRRIKQMGFAWEVYPGAEHSRFGHALGAFHVARRAVTQLGLSGDVARDIKVAALVHDIGHGPFSHAWEQVFPASDHEMWGARLVVEDCELSGVLTDLADGLPQRLSDFWHRRYRPGFARKLVSSQLDVDRLDYLLRDGHYSGVGYATYDLDWILHALRLERIPAAGTSSEEGERTDVVVDYRRGMYAVEQYLFARSYMYAQVYHHKTVRAAEWMFIKLMQRFCQLARKHEEPSGLIVAAQLARGEPVGTDAYICLDDIAVLSAIDRWAGLGAEGSNAAASDPVLADLSQRLVRRRLFKTIDLGDDPEVVQRVRDPVRAVAEERFGPDAAWYYHLDTTRQIGYSADGDDELYVVDHPRHGTVTLGRLLEDMPLGQPQSRVRLVCAPEILSALKPICHAALRPS